MMEFAADKADNVREAQTQTADVIKTMYRHVGWDVTIVWKNEPVEADVKNQTLASNAK